METIDKIIYFCFDTPLNILGKAPKGFVRLAIFPLWILFFVVWETIFVLPAILMMIADMCFDD